MRRIILIGPIGCGKSTLCQVLNERELRYRKTQAIEFLHDTIDTPGEYLENRRLNAALMITAVQAEVVILMQACDDERVLFAPGFSSLFGGKPVWGVASKADLAKTAGHVKRVEEKLLRAGAERTFCISCYDSRSIRRLRSALA